MYLELDANVTSNVSTEHKSLSQYVEEIADILFQYDVSISSMFHYFNALRVKESHSYQNFMNSISISTEITDFVKETLINCTMILT
jgi:signal recognition particle GTPase